MLDIYADRWISQLCVLFLTLQGNLSMLLKPEEFNQGVCDGQMLNVSINVTCEFSEARAIIRGGPIGGNMKTYCKKETCTNGGNFNRKDNILKVSFPIVYKSHIGNLLEISVTCLNGSVLEDRLPMVPCLSRFNHSVECNSTHAWIICEHNSYQLSKHGMRLKNATTGNYLDNCVWLDQSSRCIKGLATGLPNGAQYILPYGYGHEILCEMDGQSVYNNIACNQVNRKDDQTGGHVVHSNAVLLFGCVLLPFGCFLALLLPQYCC
ncbi:uncharacterized protein LOC133199078 [Saccostrea echinata]|uniref:uncharacterized protein LOC133199078 n=1 Tax=Saccostrea echinata TaxID=191078 RepID=UPI002A83C72E|nr:uncharacterized protein LOC133199078 [Saccostrea echinata]